MLVILYMYTLMLGYTSLPYQIDNLYRPTSKKAVLKLSCVFKLYLKKTYNNYFHSDLSVLSLNRTAIQFIEKLILINQVICYK